MRSVPEVEAIALQELGFGASPRLRPENVEYSRALAEVSAELLPPITVHRSQLTVIDGLHRSRAALLRGERTIRAEFFDGTSEEAFLFSVEANRANGLPLSLAERKAAAARLIAMFPDRSDRAIAGSAGLSDKTVARLRRSAPENPRPNTRAGADERRRLAARLLAFEPRTSLRRVAGEVGLSPATVLDVRRRLARGEDPVPAGSPRAVVLGTGLCRPEPGNRKPALDPEVVLGHLRRDPALTSSASGRDLLRWLHAHAVSRERGHALLNDAPPHCRDRIADLAEVYAERWHRLARSLRDRSGDTWPKPRREEVARDHAPQATGTGERELADRPRDRRASG